MISRLQYLYKYYKEYGFRCFFALVLSKAFPYQDNSPEWKWNILQYRHKAIMSYLDKHYYANNPINLDTDYETYEQYHDCIWTAWLQGEENAPEIIQITIASIKANSNGHPVIVLTNSNYYKYIDIPNAIRNKYEKGIIGAAHFADVIRMKILAKYGGVWLDATMLINEPIDERGFLSSFYSLGYKSEGKKEFVTEHKWIVGIIGGNAKSSYLKMIDKMLSSYWKGHEIPIDYFVFDYFIALLCKKDTSFNRIIDNLSTIQHTPSALRNIINLAYNSSIFAKMFYGNQIFTLTYRCSYFRQTAEGKSTYYDHLCKKYLEQTT